MLFDSQQPFLSDLPCVFFLIWKVAIFFYLFLVTVVEIRTQKG
jgi:hypothetical protein